MYRADTHLKVLLIIEPENAVLLKSYSPQTPKKQIYAYFQVKTNASTKLGKPTVLFNVI